MFAVNLPSMLSIKLLMTAKTNGFCRLIHSYYIWAWHRKKYKGIQIAFFFSFPFKNIYCGYSLEAPLRGTSNEYQQYIFLWRNKKNQHLFDWKRWLIKRCTPASNKHKLAFQQTGTGKQSWSQQSDFNFFCPLQIHILLNAVANNFRRARSDLWISRLMCVLAIFVIHKILFARSSPSNRWSGI